MLNAIHILGQILFGGYFIWQGLNHFINHQSLTEYAAVNKVPLPAIAVGVSGLLMVLGGLGVFLNLYVNIALLLLIIFLLPATLTIHAYWTKTDPAERYEQQSSFLRNIAFLGAALLLIQ